MSVAGVSSGNQLVDELRRALGQRGSRDDLVEARFVRRAETGSVCVVRVAEDRDVRPGVRNLVRVDPREVAKAVAYLASAESGLMTGANIDFDQTILGAHD